MPGAVALRTRSPRSSQSLYGVAADPDTEITVTSGATEAIFCAIQAVVRPGDEVIVLDPCYDSYEPSVTLAGGRAVHVPLHAAGVRDRLGALRSSLSARTRLMIVNTPHNPSGTVLSRADLDRARRAACALRLLCLERRGLRARRVRRPPSRDRARAAGARAALLRGVLVRQDLSRDGLEARLLRRARADSRTSCGACTNTSRSPRRTPLQHALADYHDARTRAPSRSAAFYQERRDYFASLLASTKFALRAGGGHLFPARRLSARSPTLPDVEFARWLTVEHGVAAIPVSVFYSEPPDARLVRFCFAKEHDARSTPRRERLARSFTTG